MWRRLIQFGFAAAALLAAATPSSAQKSCGSPPDPRTNTGGYISWCVCMGGVYNTGTTACVGARGPRSDSGATSSGPSWSWPAQHWYCRARARNGAAGWARYADRGRAESEAIRFCDQNARGGACRVIGCSYNDGGSAANTDGVPAFGVRWECRARAGNGASGRGWSGNRHEAETYALGYCDQNARGSVCRVVSCTANGQAVPVGSQSASTPPATSTAPATGSPPFTQLRQPTATCGGRQCLADQICGPTNRCYNPNTHFYCGTTRCVKGRNYAANTTCGQCGDAPAQAGRVTPAAPFPFGAQTCEQCYRKLKNDIRFGWMTQRPRSYIGQAVAGYEGCKQKATGSCTAPDGFRAAVRGCASPSFNDAGARACVERVLTGDPANF